MGMYDTIKLQINCPQYGYEYLEFQTKDGDCCLDIVLPESVENFYTSCDKCNSYINFYRLDDEFISFINKRGKLDKYWKFGGYYYECFVRYRVNYKESLIKDRESTFIRELKDKILKD